jgi:osmoprotectant transport system ATP-binding protein
LPVVEFQSVRYAFPHANTAVVDGIDLTLETGESVALVGRSGAGKSTLLKLANRLLVPQSGAVLVDGRDTRQWDPFALRRRTGYVLQETGLFAHMTIEQNVSIVPRLDGWPEPRRRTRAFELLDLVGLPPSEYAARWPRELSGGQRQRVGVARALAARPPVLLMDEPFGALDPVTRSELQREFTRIHRELALTVLLVTHDIAEAFALGSRVGVIDAGRLIVCDRPAQVARSADPRVRQFLDAVPSLQV